LRVRATCSPQCAHNNIPFVEAGTNDGTTAYPLLNGESLCAYLQKNGYQGHAVPWILTHDCDGFVVASRAFCFCHGATDARTCFDPVLADQEGDGRSGLWERDVVLAGLGIGLQDIAFFIACSLTTTNQADKWPSRNGPRSTKCILDSLWERKTKFLNSYQRTKQPSRRAWQTLVNHFFDALRLVRAKELLRSPDDDASVSGTDLISLFRAEWRFHVRKGRPRTAVAWTRLPSAEPDTTAHEMADEILRILVCDFKESTKTTAPTADDIQNDPEPYLKEGTEFFACCDFHMDHMIQRL